MRPTSLMFIATRIQGPKKSEVEIPRISAHFGSLCLLSSAGRAIFTSPIRHRSDRPRTCKSNAKMMCDLCLDSHGGDGFCALNFAHKSAVFEYAFFTVITLDSKIGQRGSQIGKAVGKWKKYVRYRPFTAENVRCACRPCVPNKRRVSRERKQGIRCNRRPSLCGRNRHRYSPGHPAGLRGWRP